MSTATATHDLFFLDAELSSFRLVYPEIANKHMKEFWNDRYAQELYVYGTEPNEFFRKILDRLPVGNILLPADGEGRNAVYAAKKGWKVTAFDYSDAGRQKALRLAKEKGVAISFTTEDIRTFQFHKGYYDAVGLCYVHQPPDLREYLHRSVSSALKPGGTLILEGFSKEQLALQSGGPRDPELLFSTEILAHDFAGLEIIQLEERTTALSEGTYHAGEARVVRLVARKPAQAS